MPELPFVTVLSENLTRQVRGREIRDVVVRGVSVLKTVDPPIDRLRGARITDVRRRGKYLLIDVDPDLVLVVHLMRNGRLQLAAEPAPGRTSGRGGRDLAFALVLDDGRTLRLIEMGTKKRAAVWLFRRGDEVAGPLAGLGIEPLSDAFTPAALTEMLRAGRMRLKQFLTTQRFVVGVGNAYADEILWEARLSPQAMTTTLGPDEIDRLHAAIRSTLTRGINGHRETLGEGLPMKEPLELLSVHRHGREPCPRCGTPIAVIFYEDRETYYCPGCQAGGKVYADRRRSRLLR